MAGVDPRGGQRPGRPRGSRCRDRSAVQRGLRRGIVVEFRHGTRGASPAPRDGNAGCSGARLPAWWRRGRPILSSGRCNAPASQTCPGASVGDFASRQGLVDAFARGELDRWILKPGCFADEEFHRSITELLEDWAAAARPPCYEAVQIIGEQWSQRGVELREFMSRNSMTFGFYDCATDEGHELLLAHNLTLAVARLPIVIVQFRPDLAPLQNPSDEILTDAFGVNASVDDVRRVDVTIIGAGPAGLRPPSTVPQKASTRSWSSALRWADRQGPLR